MTIIGAKWAAILLDSSGDLIQGNTIGGTTAAGQENRYGIFMVAGNNTIGGAVANTIGGTGASAGNVISGNRLAGVAIAGANTSGNLVEGNFIGTDSAQSNTIGNGVAGVLINAGAVNNTIGGIVAGAEQRDLGQQVAGVLSRVPTPPATSCRATSSALTAPATTRLETASLACSSMPGRRTTRSVGQAPAAGNVISGNKAAGVSITGADTAGNLVQGNFIGTNPTGTGALSNQNGVLIQAGAVNNTIGGAVANTIGGTGASAGNVISGNRSAGVAITGAGTCRNVGAGQLHRYAGRRNRTARQRQRRHSDRRGCHVEHRRGNRARGGEHDRVQRTGRRPRRWSSHRRRFDPRQLDLREWTRGQGPRHSAHRGANGNELPPTIKSLTPGTAGSIRRSRAQASHAAASRCSRTPLVPTLRDVSS